MTEEIQAVSVWQYDEPKTRLNGGRLIDLDDRWRVRVSLKRWRDADLPTNVDGWPIAVWRENGEHIHSEVADHTQTPAAVKLDLASTGPAIVTQHP